MTQNTAKQNYPGSVAFPFTALDQEMRSAYSTMLQSPHAALCSRLNFTSFHLTYAIYTGSHSAPLCKLPKRAVGVARG